MTKTSDLMSSRFKNFAFGTRRKSNSPNIAKNTSALPSQTTLAPPPNLTPTSTNTSTPGQNSIASATAPTLSPNNTATTIAYEASGVPTISENPANVTNSMNPALNGARPPSYSFNPGGPRTTSPMPPGGMLLLLFFHRTILFSFESWERG